MSQIATLEVTIDAESVKSITSMVENLAGMVAELQAEVRCLNARVARIDAGPE